VAKMTGRTATGVIVTCVCSALRSFLQALQNGPRGIIGHRKDLVDANLTLLKQDKISKYTAGIYANE